MTGAAEAFAKIKALGRAGEFFRQVDLASRSVVDFPEDWRLKHQHVLALANAGAREYAQEVFAQYGLDKEEALDAYTLYARLLKDQALTSPWGSVGRRDILTKAAIAYETAMKAPGAENLYYPEDNAAQLYLLAGEMGKARAHAKNVLQQLESLAPDEFDMSWRLASRLNALVIMGDYEAAAALAPEVAKAFKGDGAGAATTIEHLDRLATYLRIDAPWIDTMRPPCAIMYSGHIIAAPGKKGRIPASDETRVAQLIRAAMKDKDIGHAYGSLAAGADILFAEALLDAGAGLTVVLPCAEDNFLSASVAPSGGDWVKRYHKIRERDEVQVLFATAEPLMQDDNLFAYNARLAMGLAVLRAQHLKTYAEQIALWDGKPARGVSGTAADISLWQQEMTSGLRRRQTIIPLQGGTPGALKNVVPSGQNTGDKAPDRRVARAILFGDFAGFSKLKDPQIPIFAREVLGAAAKILTRHKDKVLFQNTWGDGIYVVTKRAWEAATIALEIQAAMDEIPFAELGLPDSLKFRIGGHLGPVFQQTDPVLQRDNYFGAQVSHAARIEPVVPPGATYVSGQFAAALAFAHGADFRCDIVGTTNLAKNYGATRIFLLRKQHRE